MADNLRYKSVSLLFKADFASLNMSKTATVYKPCITYHSAVIAVVCIV